LAKKTILLFIHPKPVEIIFKKYLLDQCDGRALLYTTTMKVMQQLTQPIVDGVMNKKMFIISSRRTS